MFAARHAGEEPLDLRRAQHDGQELGPLGGREEVGHRPRPFEGHAVEEAEGRHGGQDGVGSQPLLGGQEDLVRAQVRGPQDFGGSPEMAGEPRDLVQVCGLGARGEVPDLHVLDHALPKGGHDALLCEEERGKARGSPSMVSQQSADGKRVTEGSRIHGIPYREAV